jgi:hypothetical protein
MTLMRFKPAPHQDFRPVCIVCDKRIDPPDYVVADLDGKPFTDYYHPRCVPPLQEVHE